MSEYLMIDVGAGTMDLLWLDDETLENYRAVVKSPVRVLAENIDQTKGDLLVVGGEMGGGPVTRALKERAKTARVFIGKSASATLSHDPDKVRAMGLKVLEDEEAGRLESDEKYPVIHLDDVDPGRITRILSQLGVCAKPDVIGLCAQDHGAAPAGVSHMHFRHEIFTRALEENPAPRALLHAANQIPRPLNRLRRMARCAEKMNPEKIFVMDSGMAAIAGAAKDPAAFGKNRIMVLDVATSHTVCAVLEHEDLAGFFEYHTKDVSAPLLDRRMGELANGGISHQGILDQGGHGAFLRKAVGFDKLEAIVATGPKRGLLAESTHPILWGAPWGDNMMTGCVGLMTLIRERLGKPPVMVY
jgi:uncharacterized protein (DUF1786 family)